MKLTRRATLKGAAAAMVMSDRATARDAANAVKYQSETRIVNLRVDYVDRPLGLRSQKPLLSWRMECAHRGARQTAYRVRVARGTAGSGVSELWDSGRVESSRSFGIAYAGAPLASGERAEWSVEVWDERRLRRQSESSWWEAGLLEPSDWRAQWLVAEDAETLAERALGVNWIWGETQADSSPRRFRWPVKRNAAPAEALLMLSAKDTLVCLWVDGVQVLRTAQWLSWGTFTSLDLTKFLGRGEHVIAFEVTERTDQARPVIGGAVAGYLRLREADGSIVRKVLDEEVRTSLAVPHDAWVARGFDDSLWPRARAAAVHPDCYPWPSGPAVLLRRSFEVRKPVARARLYATALGAYEVRLNGERVSDRKLAPESTDFRSRALYQVHDIGTFIKPGANAIGAIVADGWFASAFSYLDLRYSFGEPPRRFLAQIEIRYEDGSSETITTDETWRIARAPILSADIYDGETYDARLEIAGWDMAGFDDHAWQQARLGQKPPCALAPQTNAPIREIEVLQPVALRELARNPSTGIPRVYDFGQNFAGWARIKVHGAAGSTVRLRFAEVLKSSGELDTANLRRAKNTDTYILRGAPQGESYEPRFTYHGFRYVEVVANCEVLTVEGIVVHSDLAIAGTLRSSSPLIEKIWRASLWSQRSNFFGVPTDCPQRDERMGWTGDAQIFWDAAAYNMDVGAFTRRFMEDIRAAQAKTGEMPDTAPFWMSGQNTPGWADAAVILPWTTWQRYGDTGIIEQNWDAMDRWQQRLLELNPDHLWRNARGLDYGDWLSVDAKSRDDITTPKELISTAYWAYSSGLMAQMAAAIRRDGDAERYRLLSERIREAFVAQFVRHTDKRLGNGSQTSAVLALRFGLLPDSLRPLALSQLAQDIGRRGNKLSTGFLGTPYILDALAEAGDPTTALSLLTQTDYPSWGFMMTQGATTMWERWDGIRDGKVTGSLNHYALGAISGFILRRIAGIDTGSIGFERVLIRPLFDGRLTSGGGDYDSQMGRVSTDWRREINGAFRLSIRLPANTRGEVHLPVSNRARIMESARRLSGRKDVRLLRRDRELTVIELGSGSYDLSVEP